MRKNKKEKTKIKTDVHSLFYSYFCIKNAEKVQKKKLKCFF